MLVFFVLGKHLEFADGHDYVTIGGNVAEHVLVTDAGIHAAAVAENKDGQFLFLYCTSGKHAWPANCHSCIHVHRTIDNEVWQALLAHGYSLVAATATVFNHLHLFETDAGIVMLQVTGKEGIHRRTGELQLLVECHAMLTMYLYVIDCRTCLLHFHDPVLCQVGADDGVFSTLEHEKWCFTLADITYRPPFLMVCPFASTTNFCRRSSACGTGHLCRQSSHQRQMPTSRVTVGADAVGVYA